MSFFCSLFRSTTLNFTTNTYNLYTNYANSPTQLVSRFNSRLYVRCVRWVVAQTASNILRDRFLKPGGKLADTLLTPSWHTGKTCDRNLISFIFPPLVCLCSEFPSWSIRKDSFLEERLWEQFRGLHLVVSFSSHCCWFTLHRDLMYTATQLLLKLMRPS